MYLFTNSAESDDYLYRHIPYRVNAMMAADIMAHRRTQAYAKSSQARSCEERENIRHYEDPLTTVPAFEYSILAGRLLLQFLGITYNNSGNIDEYKGRQNDIMLASFPGKENVPITDHLITDNEKSIKAFLRLGNKVVTHITPEIHKTSAEDLAECKNARLVIYRILIRELPEMKKNSFTLPSNETTNPLWFHSQVFRTTFAHQFPLEL